MSKNATDARPSAASRVASFIVHDSVGGMLLIGAALIALVLANTPAQDWYHDLAGARIGPEVLHLDLSVKTWAADGLLAIFFFVVGLELKYELVRGSLRNVRQAAVPVLAAIGGMAVPAIIFATVISVSPEQNAGHGWAIPTATDIAFALAVLAIFGKGLPRSLRVFLLTLAVVDDLLAIIVIAIFYTDKVELLPLFYAVIAVVVFAWLVRRNKVNFALAIPVASVAWYFMHESGVHATIAGVLLGLVVPARELFGEKVSRLERFEHRVKPVSTGIALPLFAFFTAGVTVLGGEGASEVLVQPVVLAVVLGLVAGKLIGVMGVTALVTRATPLRLPNGIGLRDMLPVAFLTGIGFTVSLLIAELSFSDGEHTDGAKIAVLLGSGIAALLGAVTLRLDARRQRSRDMNRDGVPDTPEPTY